MPRKPRILIDGMALHIVQRGVDRNATFFDTEDYLHYLELLREAGELFDLQIHAYCLMTNHIHLLLTPVQASELPRAMKRLTQLYVQRVNRIYSRSGPLWAGRYKASLVGSANYLLSCYRYVELNPVRAKMVEHPVDYPWSSYKHNSGKCPSPLISPHSVYYGLGADPLARQQSYLSLVNDGVDNRVLEQIRDATSQGFPLGDSLFLEQIEEMIGRRLELKHPGRPSKLSLGLRQK